MAKRHADLIGRAPDDAALAPALVGRQDKFKLIRNADRTCHKQGRSRSCHVSNGAVDCGTWTECDAAALEHPAAASSLVCSALKFRIGKSVRGSQYWLSKGRARTGEHEYDLQKERPRLQHGLSYSPVPVEMSPENRIILQNKMRNPKEA